MNLLDISSSYSSEVAARSYLEKMIWPDGPICPHCQSKQAYKLTPKATSRKPIRRGLYKCADCRERYTVTVGTIFEDSHIPLNKWLMAIHLMCASKKGMSAHQLHRMLGITYKCAWFMGHRIRYAMAQQSFIKMQGVIECDETYVGGKGKTQFRGRATGATRTAVVSVISRHGEARSFPVTRVTADNLRTILKKNVERSAHLCTDQFSGYLGLNSRFASHQTVNHSEGEYSRGWIHVNNAEGFFATLKRGIHGVYHQVGQDHLHRYLAEFDFRYNHRKTEDGIRTLCAIRQVSGKRLLMREPLEERAS